jgi:hypothetical protein
MNVPPTPHSNTTHEPHKPKIHISHRQPELLRIRDIQSRNRANLKQEVAADAKNSTEAAAVEAYKMKERAEDENNIVDAETEDIESAEDD